jgi:hypothetical protein
VTLTSDHDPTDIQKEEKVEGGNETTYNSFPMTNKSNSGCYREISVVKEPGIGKENLSYKKIASKGKILV